MTVDEAMLATALRHSHGVIASAVDRVRRGVTTFNFTAIDDTIGPLFVKVYPVNADLVSEEDAIGLSEFAAAAGVPTADVVPARTGEHLTTCTGLAYSVWRFIDAPSGQDTGLTAEQLTHMGTVLGRMHRRFANHPVSRTTTGSLVPAPDLTTTTATIGALLGTIDPDDTDPVRAWIRDALHERTAIAERVQAMRLDPFEYSAQVIHGDLAAPNVLLAQSQIAAVIDFCPPRRGTVAHDISRIGCDPRTVLRLGPGWPAALAALAAAYQEHNPTHPAADLVGCVRWWIRYTTALLYPLRTLLAAGPCADADLAVYAQQRHLALLAVLDLADEAEALLRDTVYGKAGPR